MRSCKFTKPLLVLGLIALVAIPAAAQEPAWRSFSTADGLPANRTLALAQDTEGTLWVGTDRGLRSFFGHRFYPEDAMPDMVRRARINALLATPDNSLWVGSSAGLFRRNQDGSWTQDLTQQAGLNSSEINALLLDHAGAVWVGGWGGLARWDGSSWETITARGTAPQVNSLAEDSEGRLWIVEPIWIRILHNGELVKTIGEEDGLPLGAQLKQLLCDRQGDMWLATAGGLVQLVNLSVQRVFTQEDGLGSSAIWTVAESYEGGLWVGSEFGLAHFKDGVVGELMTSADGLADDRVLSLFRDNEGNLWIGTDGGLSRIPLGQWAIETHPLLRRVSISALLLDEPSGNYAAVLGGIMHQVPDGRWTLLEDGLPGKTTYTLVLDGKGQLWAGTDGGLARLENGRFVPDERVPPTQTVTALLADSQGALWVGTHNGLHYLTDDAQALYSKSGGELGQDSVLALWETKAGDVWIGTLAGGASRFHQGEWSQINSQSTAGGLGGDVVLAGAEDKAGNLWFGTNQGLSRLRADAAPNDHSAWHTFIEPDIVNNRVNVLWEDTLRPGHIWAGTESGLNLIVDDHSSAFTHQDGLSHKRITALGQQSDGTLWIGTPLGLSYHRNTSQPPQIRLGELLINHKPCDAGCLVKGLAYNAGTALFQYSGSDLGNLDGLQYRPILQTSTDSAKFQASFSLTSTIQLPIDLEPGTIYTLTVTAVDKDFNESPPTQPLVLHVDDASAWDQLRDHRFFPYMVLGALVFVLFGGSAGGISVARWYRMRNQYPFHDVHITVKAAESGQTCANLEAHRIKTSSVYRLLGRLTRWVPARGQRSPSSLSVEDVPIDLAHIGEIRESIARLGDDQVNELRLQFIGRTLYEVLLAPKPIAEQLERLGLGFHGLRLRLSFDGHAELSNLPWELLHGGEKIGFLGQRADTALVRFVEPGEDFQRPVVDKQLRVLVVMAQPNDERVRKLNLIAEKNRLDQALAGIAQVEYLLGVHAAKVLGTEAEAEHLPEQLLKRLADNWDVVHFVGHAGPDLEPAGEPEVVLWCEDRRGDYMALSSEDLEKGLKTAQAPKLVVLNACQTASLASKLVRIILDGGVGAVVGMQWPVLDLGAESFTDGFYSTLRYNGQVDRAMSIARNQMARRTGGGRRDWASPVLVMQTIDGLIFERL